jgi:peptidoglycan-associated lipoprotein
VNVSNSKWLRLLAVMLLVTTVAACSGNKNKGQDGAGTDGTTLGTDGANAQGVGTDGGLTADEMRDRELRAGNIFYFEFDQSQISEETRAKLDTHLQTLRGDGSRVRLEGHADERGTPEYNLALGERRAKAIANYLILNGVDRSRIEVVSYGEEKPVALGQDEESYRLNRRVELVR